MRQKNMTEKKIFSVLLRLKTRVYEYLNTDVSLTQQKELERSSY